jgi:hypothetical protein
MIFRLQVLLNLWHKGTKLGSNFLSKTCGSKLHAIGTVRVSDSRAIDDVIQDEIQDMNDC